MNTQLNAVLRKFTLGALFLIIIATAQAQSSPAVTAPVQSSPNMATAAPAPAPVAGDTESPAMVKYLGVQDDMLIFKVACKNPDGASFSVIVRDEEGTSLYQAVFKEKNFSKQFRLPRADRSKVVFIIRDLKANELAKTFEVNVNSRYIDEVAVKKID